MPASLTLVQSIMCLTVVAGRHCAEVARTLGLTRNQLSTLMVIAFRQPACVSCASTLTGLPASSISRTVGSLESRDLISCTRHANDRRYEWLALTPAGSELLDRACTMMRRRLLGCATLTEGPEETAAARCLQKMVDRTCRVPAAKEESTSGQN